MRNRESDRIDFISEYCDRWCERCAFTSRCSAYAVKVATDMCGDFVQGLELAVGRPHPVGSSPTPRPALDLDDEPQMPTAEELKAFEKSEEEADARVHRSVIMEHAFAVATVSHRWLGARAERLSAESDEVLKEALEIAAWDAVFVAPKLGRALRGRDDYNHGNDGDDHPVQNDWNGSAKVALISIDRSENAWRTIAEATGDNVATELADALAGLGRQVESAFPNARSFIRPGFDKA